MKRISRILIEVGVSVVLILAVLVLLASCGLLLENGEKQARELDLSGYELKLVYEADFSKPLNFVRENDLFKDGERIRKPEGFDWVAEGAGNVWTEDGRLCVSNIPVDNQKHKGSHMVLWNTRVFPDNFLLEFDFSPRESKEGLAIIFFCAIGTDGGGIFDLGQPYRGGVFSTYHSGGLNGYHLSYWATWGPLTHFKPRYTSNLRKNYGFELLGSGKDYIWNQGPGPHKVRLLKVDGRIQLEIRGLLALSLTDTGGVWGKGCIGLRTMEYVGKATYDNFKVWEVRPK